MENRTARENIAEALGGEKIFNEIETYLLLSGCAIGDTPNTYLVSDPTHTMVGFGNDNNETISKKFGQLINYCDERLGYDCLNGEKRMDYLKSVFTNENHPFWNNAKQVLEGMPFEKIKEIYLNGSKELEITGVKGNINRDVPYLDKFAEEVSSSESSI